MRLVEAVSLIWNHSLSFVAFLGLGGLLLSADILLYLWALVSQSSAQDVHSTDSADQK